MELVRVRILASSLDDPRDTQFLTSFLINDSVAIDAGCAGFHGSPREQARINHVFLTHSHADHLCSLPMLVTNVHEERGDAVNVYGHDHVLRSLRNDVFNGRLWPDLLQLGDNGSPFVRLQRLEPEEAVIADGLRVTPVFVNHVVPTFGYIVEDDEASVVFCSDTGPTERIWQVAGARQKLKAIFLDASFPARLADIAAAAAHLTPELFGAEVAKLGREVDVIAVHIKPGHRKQVLRELEDLRLDRLHIGTGGREYRF
jgi:ribonuclease BN (tRNA processing enzyme)